ncbi:unnamed protein product [Phytophthora fragariaefolia]|uniref:Unnamed protein product n=1 Tax=Phytophthora fragariaefolia TaxID=1490495 RepID=A0A9W6UDC7_9STRA|nr:unnamed protein product [Phytophthora fragariaefolia]
MDFYNWNVAAEKRPHDSIQETCKAISASACEHEDPVLDSSKPDPVAGGHSTIFFVGVKSQCFACITTPSVLLPPIPSARNTTDLGYDERYLVRR